MKGRSGSVLLMAVIMSLAILPSHAAPVFKKHPELAFRCWFECSRRRRLSGPRPPWRMTGSAAAWGLLSAGVLDRRGFRGAGAAGEPAAGRHAGAGSAKLSWDSPYERVSRPVRPGQRAAGGPLAALLRAQQPFPRMYLLALPLAAFLTFNMSRRARGSTPSSWPRWAPSPSSRFLGTARIAVNQFGYVGGGLRRYFLLPTDPGASLRAGSYASMLLGGAMIPVAAIGWVVLAPVAFDPRCLHAGGQRPDRPVLISRPGTVGTMLNPRDAAITTAASATTCRWAATWC